MIQSSAYKNCSEFYEIAKIVEFVIPYRGEDTQIRIEVLHDLQTDRFSTSVYYKEHFNLQPSYPVQSGNFANKPADFQVWVPLPNTAWVDRNTADEAITQALGFIGAH